jgi:hypothetical protein
VIDFPKGVRIAQPNDEQRIYDLCCIMHAENGYGEMDPDIVRLTIMKATERKGNIIAFIDGPERVEAAIGLQPIKPWYCADKPTSWYWSELFLYVHPLYRRSNHASKLFHFAKWWEAEMRMPVMLGLMPRADLPGKEKLFARHGRHVGSFYLIGGQVEWPSVEATECKQYIT